LDQFDFSEDGFPILSIPTMTPEQRRHAFWLREQGILDGSIKPNAFDPATVIRRKPNPVPSDAPFPPPDACPDDAGNTAKE